MSAEQQANQSDPMQGFVDRSKKILVVISILGVAIYAIAMLANAFHCPFFKNLFKDGTEKFMFGLPISGVVAFAIVALLDTIAPATKDSSGNLEFKAFGLSFSGPAGHVTLWIAVYLTLVSSIRIIGA